MLEVVRRVLVNLICSLFLETSETVTALQLTCSAFSGHQSSFKNWAAQNSSIIQPLYNPWSNSSYIGTPFMGMPLTSFGQHLLVCL
jgi:hypothetical protein